MSDSRIQQLRRRCRAGGGIDDWKALEAALVSAGQSGAETFDALFALYEQAMTDASAHEREVLKRKRVRAEEIYAADPDCVMGRGDMIGSHRSLERAHQEMKADLDAAMLAANEAADIWNQYRTAAEITHEARVRYVNPRARAKFARPWSAGGEEPLAVARSGERVPVGTEGVVFWVSERRDRFGNITTKLGIETDDGNRFFTTATNCTPQAINAWELLRERQANGTD